MEIQFLIASLIGGMLTVLAPCIIPVLPILLGGSSGANGRRKAYIITGALTVSVVVFTLLIRISANTLNLSQGTLNTVSGSILIAFGLFTIFPEIWDWISLKLKLSTSSNKLMGRFTQGEGFISNALLGASLGPVFTSCSPTYAAAIALVLQGDITTAVATTYIVVYALGLAAMLLIIALAGHRAVSKLGWATDPHGWFKRIIGFLFLLVGIAIITGFDKTIEAELQRFYDPIANFEDSLRGD